MANNYAIAIKIRISGRLKRNQCWQLFTTAAKYLWKELCCLGAMAQRWTPLTRYMLWLLRWSDIEDYSRRLRWVKLPPAHYKWRFGQDGSADSKIFLCRSSQPIGVIWFAVSLSRSVCRGQLSLTPECPQSVAVAAYLFRNMSTTSTIKNAATVTFCGHSQYKYYTDNTFCFMVIIIKLWCFDVCGTRVNRYL